MATATIAPGAVVDCRELTDAEYEHIADILDAHAESLGGASYSYPRRDFLFIDGEADTNAVDAVNTFGLDFDTADFIQQYGPTGGFFGAGAYEVKAADLLPEE